MSVHNVRVIAVVLLVVALAACQGNRGLLSGSNSQAPKTVQLSLQLASEPNGNLRCSVHAKSEQPIFQLSTRVMFNPLAIKPVGVERGGLVGEQAVFFALEDRSGYVPLAFTYHQGDSYHNSSGVVADIEFEVLDASHPANIRFDVNEEYLIARDAGGNNLPVALAVVK